ncbi:helix-turn-helix domain-containing protein [Streptomyces sp. TP-A0874]|uniref:helix-turn-helix domain-containing protein n=1 Tax=Streptomyces sp. TP-A0874 TaxID=549819 RepID=UPI000852B6BE|nr:helix-turn-helix transcriptional regulator [Streptomyces sp. TP-A0874]
MTANRTDRGTSVSTVLGRRLGGELLKLREERGLKQPHAAEALTSSVAKVAKMERGWVPVRDPDIRALCHLYDVQEPGIIDRLLKLAKADRERRKARGWWNQYPELPDMVEYVALEDIATSVRTWQFSLVPGLFQTAEYARALAVGNGVWEDPGQIEPFVESRMARQARLTGERPLHVWAVLHEAALHQLVGGRDVMREQLERLLETTQLPNVRLQVVPYSAGAHPGMSSAFTIVSFADPGALDVVYMDTASSTLWLESESDATHHSGIFDRIARLSLAQRDATNLIERVRREM